MKAVPGGVLGRREEKTKEREGERKKMVVCVEREERERLRD